MGRPRRKKAKTDSEQDKAEASTSKGQSTGGGSGSGDFVTKQDLEQLVTKLLTKHSAAKHSAPSDLASDQSSDSEDNNSDLGSSGSESDSEITFEGEKKGFKSVVNSHLKPSQKAKIWSFQYVKLHTILPPSYTAHDEGREYEDFQFKRLESGHVKVRSKGNKEHNLTFKEWNDAFDVLASTIIEKYPQKAQGLIKYRMDIRHAYTKFRGTAWRDYDEKYRRKHNGSDEDWGIKDVEEWLNVFTASSGREQPVASKGRGKSTQSSAGGATSRPLLTCHQYNKGLECRSRPCRYHHLCEGCQGRHPVFSCGTTQSHQGHGHSPAKSFKPANQQQGARPTTSGILPRKP